MLSKYLSWIAAILALIALLVSLGVLGPDKGGRANGGGDSSAQPPTPLTYFKFTNKEKGGKKAKTVGYVRCNDAGCSAGQNRSALLDPRVPPTELPANAPPNDFTHDPSLPPAAPDLTFAVKLMVRVDGDAAVNSKVFTQSAGKRLQQAYFTLTDYDAGTDKYTVDYVLYFYDDAGNAVAEPETGNATF